MLFLSIHRGSDKLLSPHFKEYEFFSRCPDYKKNEHPLAQPLIRAAEIIREFMNEPVYITSTWRTAECNKISGGAPDSYHLSGKAVDLVCPLKMKILNDAVAQRGYLYHLLRVAGINGFGLNDRFLHIDCRSYGYISDKDYGSYTLWYY